MYRLFLIYMLCTIPSQVQGYTVKKISSEQISSIGKKVWQNECGGSYDGLTTWKQGEAWPSLGILHMISFVDDARYPYQEMFPEFLKFCQKKGKFLPAGILGPDKRLIWKSRQAFYAQFQSPAMKALRQFLYDTIPLQAEFMVIRLYKTVPSLLRQLPEKKRLHVQQQFERVAQSDGGMYALVDYLNFKGDGTKKKEAYQGVQWGLLQVLEGMHGTAKGKPALQEFARSAKKVLEHRVHHAPAQRKEQQWLQGWYNRIDTYMKP